MDIFVCKTSADDDMKHLQRSAIPPHGSGCIVIVHLSRKLRHSWHLRHTSTLYSWCELLYSTSSCALCIGISDTIHHIWPACNIPLPVLPAAPAAVFTCILNSAIIHMLEWQAFSTCLSIVTSCPLSFHFAGTVGLLCVLLAGRSLLSVFDPHL